MSKYEEMSDRQLCEAVLRIKRPELFNDDFIHKFVDGKMLAVFHNINGSPCGYAGHFSLSWADMGPLILELGISLISPKYNQEDDGIWYVSASAPDDEDDDLLQCFYARSENPLRAAVIVHLMIKDSE